MDSSPWKICDPTSPKISQPVCSYQRLHLAKLSFFPTAKTQTFFFSKKKQPKTSTLSNLGIPYNIDKKNLGILYVLSKINLGIPYILKPCSYKNRSSKGRRAANNALCVTPSGFCLIITICTGVYTSDCVLPSPSGT